MVAVHVDQKPFSILTERDRRALATSQHWQNHFRDIEKLGWLDHDLLHRLLETTGEQSFGRLGGWPISIQASALAMYDSLSRGKTDRQQRQLRVALNVTEEELNEHRRKRAEEEDRYREDPQKPYWAAYLPSDWV